MPELPEVEVVARSLDELMRGRTFESATLFRARLAPDTTPRKFARTLAGAGVNFVHRRGKHILFDLDNQQTLITHLRMSGKFMLLDADRPDPKFTHAAFYLADDLRLIFQDQRHFGLMKIVPTKDLNQAKEISKLAPEPLSDEFSYEYLRTTLKSCRRTLKEVLLDQTKVCGLGNIYASEAMFLSNVSPRKRASNLTRAKTAALLESIRLVLGEAVELGASMPITPDDIGGSIYGNGSDWEWRVYDREGKECITCGSTIKRIVQAGRSSYYCPACQR